MAKSRIGSTAKSGSKRSVKISAKSAPASRIRRVARPDAPDFRDRSFQPMVSLTPRLEQLPDVVLPVKDQGATSACTGFALALVVEYLQRKSKREKQALISPFMLYSMARRYDEFPGAEADEGSSARGALKGWFKHGACHEWLYPTIAMPPASDSLDDDWWFDAVKRPLGAYYRVDPRSIADMHAALGEVGILYATAGCHSGWDEGLRVKPLKSTPRSFKSIWRIPRQGGQAQHPGHAFAIVGYCEDGFLIQNSWGPQWGSHGWAVLGYDDWIDNAMDCWVAQLGVVTAEHRAIARSMTLRTDAAGQVKLAASEVLRQREIAPFVINMSNNGQLSNSGSFRTMPDDVRAIVDVQLPLARQKFGLAADEPIDVCVYAHGGLVGEKAAAQIAARWIPQMYDAKIFPIFLMWETGALDTIMNRLSDAVRDVPRTAGGIGEQIERWWNRRLERALARPGTQLWGEMKQNADAMSKPVFEPIGGALKPQDQQPGAVQLWMHFRQCAAQHKLRVHLVGHSAGSIVASFIIDRVADAMPIESLSLMAPAVRAQTFSDFVVPRIRSGAVKRFAQFHLSERAEQDDPTCGPYRRSLLYLVSESFEGGATTPILGLQKDYERNIAPLPPKSEVHVSPGPVSTSTTHGGFDDDPGTIERIIDFIRGR